MDNCHECGRSVSAAITCAVLRTVSTVVLCLGVCDLISDRISCQEKTELVKVYGSIPQDHVKPEERRCSRQADRHSSFEPRPAKEGSLRFVLTIVPLSILAYFYIYLDERNTSNVRDIWLDLLLSLLL